MYFDCIDDELQETLLVGFFPSPDIYYLVALMPLFWHAQCLYQEVVLIGLFPQLLQEQF